MPSPPSKIIPSDTQENSFINRQNANRVHPVHSFETGGPVIGKSGLSIVEIAYEVGFNNPKTFTKFFKEEFKILPSQFAANKKEKEA